MKSLVSSGDENASEQESNMDQYGVYSKEKAYELKNSGYMKKKIISAIKKSLKTNNNKHSLTLNDVCVSEEKEIGNGCRQSLNIRIALDDKLFFSSGDAGAAPINIETFKLNDSTPTTKCCSHCSGKERNIEDAWPAYFICVKCSRKEKRKWYHEDCKEKCCTTTSIYCDNCLRFKLTSIDHNFEVLDNKFAKYMYVVTCPNGGGISLHMDYERIMHFTEDEQKIIAKEFLKEAFKEDKKGFAQFTIAIVHNGASYMPDLLKLLAELHPTLPVKTTKLKCNTETEVMDLGTYYTKVKETYSNGTFAFNPLNEIQAASVKNDECGAYLPELLSLLEKSAFLTQVLPWSDMTTKRFKSPHESDDGPIFWCRPGEQIVSLDRNSKRNRWNADEIESFLKERQQNLKYFCEKRYIVEELKKYRRSYSSREFLFEDRTRPHADQVWGNHFECTAAVGVIQAIHPDEIPEQNRACKEIVVFHAKHFEMLEALLHIDVTAAPKQQCAEWLDDAKLNMIRQMNIRYSKLHLYDNDIYFIPRKIVHQFKTISATLSVAWHTRLIEYYLEPDPPPVSEKAEENVDEPVTSVAVKNEQLSDDDDGSSSSSSSESLPPPTKTKKTIARTPKKKRKLSCSRSTASTDTEATPRKKIKPRSRSGTPQKRATPKKRVQKTPKKSLVLDEDDNENEQPVITVPQPVERPPSPVIPPEPPAPVTPTKESASVSRSASPVVAKPVRKESRSRSPSVSKKRRESEETSNESSKKKKHRSRSRSRPRKHSDPSVATDKDRKNTDSSENKSVGKKKKKNRSRSRSPKKRDKFKDTGNGAVTSFGGSSVKEEMPGTPSKSSKKSSSKKHNDDHAKLSTDSEKQHHQQRKKHRSDKDKDKDKNKRRRSDSHRSDASPKRRSSDRTPPHPSSSLKQPTDCSAGTESRPKSPSPLPEDPVPEKSPLPADASPTDIPEPTDVVVEMETEDTPTIMTDNAAIISTSATSSPSTEDAAETVETTVPSPIAISEPKVDVSKTLDVDPKILKKSPRTPPPASPTEIHIKVESNSPVVHVDEPVPVNHVTEVKAEPMEDISNQPVVAIKEEPGALTADTTKIKNTNTPAVVPAIKSASEKSLKKPVTSSSGADSTNRTSKDHRKKEKLWDTPLFMPQDCDKYEWTKRSSSSSIVSNRITTKNGDKIVKQKTLNSIQNNHSKLDDSKNNTANVKAKPTRSRSRSPPPWIKKKERKPEDNNSKPSKPSETKKPATTDSDEKRNNNAVVNKDTSTSTSSTNSSDKHHDKDSKKSVDHKRSSKEISSSGKKDKDRLEQRSSSTSDKKKSSHTSSSSGVSSSHNTKDSKSTSSSSDAKNHSHEKRKRSRSPPEKQHRDKHSSSSIKKHKKRRSKSRDRGEPALSECSKSKRSSSTTRNIDTANTSAPVTSTTGTIVNTSNETVSLENPQDVELAANYKLMIPRVQIFDIGATYKNGGSQNSADETDNDNNVPTATSSATIAQANDQNCSDEPSEGGRLVTDEPAATGESSESDV